MREKKGGIYQIRNLVNNKRYIGQTVNLYARKYGHSSLLKNNKHTNIHLQNSYNRYGKENFIFEILEECIDFSKEELTEREQFYVDQYKDSNLLYNICLECVDSKKGVVCRKETKEKMSKPCPQTSGENHWNYGKKGEDNSHTIKKDVVLKIIKLLDERKYTADIAKEIGVSTATVLKTKSGGYDKIYNLPEKHYDDGIKKYPMFGKHHKEESKRKMSESMKGKKNHMTIKEDIVREALRLMDEGMSPSNVSKQVAMSEKTVYRAKNGFYNDIYDL